MENNNFGSILSEVTQSAENSNAEQIIYIDIDELESNPRNFYGLRDVDALAGLIAVSHLIEPLTVIKNSESGKYRIISGHRRHAAVQKLLEEGIYTERKLPCIVKSCQKLKIELEDGKTVEFDEGAVEMLNLIASNRGQREERTIDEKLQEIKYLEGFARAIYNQRERKKRGRFLNFFAEEILNISKSQLHRILSLEKLTDKVKVAVYEKKISETVAAEIATMIPRYQDACLERILRGRLRANVEDVQKYKIEKLNAEKLKEEARDEGLEYADRFTITFEHERQILKRSDKISFENNRAKKKAEEIDEKTEAVEWIYKVSKQFYESLYDTLKTLSEEEKNEKKAAKFEMRASLAYKKLEELKNQHD